jgi:uncharacterized protein
MNPTAFTPLVSFLGGGLIGLATVLLMAGVGRIAGISGIFSRLLPPYHDHALIDRVAFVVGLIIAAPLIAAASGYWPAQIISANSTELIIAGLLVGFGSAYGNGCTSGHGICGLSLVSKRSIIATLIFMSTAIITVFIMRHIV